MKRQNVRTLALIVCTFTYLLMGASIFDFLESTNESDSRKNFKTWKKNCSETFKISEEDCTKIGNDALEFKYQLKNDEDSSQWRFAGSFYFATTVITTIGYGHSTPKTTAGKCFCMFYAVIGIPLCIVMFQSIGERLNTCVTWLIRKVKLQCGCKDNHVSDTHLILIASTTGILVLTVGAYVFHKCETWPYLNAFYYSFITLTTIGFGDFVALQSNNAMNKQPEYVSFSLIFILFGLTVVSSVMNLLVLRFLTMNTEDERRDEIEAAAQAIDSMRLQGDVILPAGAYYPNNIMSRKESLLSTANALNFEGFHFRDRKKSEEHTSTNASNQSFVGKSYLQRGRVCWNYFVSLFTPQSDWKTDYAQIVNYQKLMYAKQHNNLPTCKRIWNDEEASHAKCSRFNEGDSQYSSREMINEAVTTDDIWMTDDRGPGFVCGQKSTHHGNCCRHQHHAIHMLKDICDEEDEESSLGTSEDDLSSIWSRSEARKKRASV